MNCCLVEVMGIGEVIWEGIKKVIQDWIFVKTYIKNKIK
jgi:hypothetical protein